jgi:hypothetical protein
VHQLATSKEKTKKKVKEKKVRPLNDNVDDEQPPLVKRRNEDSSDDEDDDDEPPPPGKIRAKNSSDDEDDDPPPTPKAQVNRKSKHISLRQRDLLSADHLTEQDVLNTASVYHARNFPDLPMVIGSGASVSITPHIRDFRCPLHPPPQVVGWFEFRHGSVRNGSSHMGDSRPICVKRQITTMVYYIPKANIIIFFPKVYFGEQMASHDMVVFRTFNSSAMSWRAQIRTQVLNNWSHKDYWRRQHLIS